MLWLQEMQIGRVAESAQAGRGNLQTQTGVSDGAEPGDASQEMEQEENNLGPEPSSLSPVPTCAVREKHEEERGPGHGAHSP